MDFVTAFLNGYVEEEIYMKQPEGYEDGTEKVCKIVKSLYGLKQAPRQWNIKLNESMIELGFEQLKSDTSVYIKENLIVAVYVDDCILVSNSKNAIITFKRNIQDMYSVKDLGELKEIVGMQWKRDRSKRESVLYQEKYALDILDRFGMTESKLVKTPAIKEVEDQDEKFNDIELYQQCVGSLIYLNTCTRPDLSIAVSLLARKCRIL